MFSDYRKLPSPPDNYEQLKKYNLWAALAHLTSFVVLLGFTIAEYKGSFKAQLTTDFLKHSSKGVRPESGPYRATLETVGVLQLVWVQLSFPLITSGFHFYIWADAENKYRQIIKNRVNPYRWLEYGITATIMTNTILQLSGVTNVFLLMNSGILSILLQLSGYLIERLDTTAPPNVGIPMGWAIFVAQWTTIMWYFFVATTSRSVPWFVYTVIITMFVMFSLFGLVQMLYIFGNKTEEDYKRMEKRFIVLSFVSKLSLDWIIMIGLLTNGRAD